MSLNKTKSSEWLLREKWHFKFDEFQVATEKSIKECGDLPKIKELFLHLHAPILRS